jgi:hypothetical protein
VRKIEKDKEERKIERKIERKKERKEEHIRKIEEERKKER